MCWYYPIGGAAVESTGREGSRPSIGSNLKLRNEHQRERKNESLRLVLRQGWLRKPTGAFPMMGGGQYDMALAATRNIRWWERLGDWVSLRRLFLFLGCVGRLGSVGRWFTSSLSSRETPGPKKRQKLPGAPAEIFYLPILPSSGHSDSL